MALLPNDGKLICSGTTDLSITIADNIIGTSEERVI